MTDVIKLGKKAFTWSVVATTILWSVGFATLAPLMAHAADECPALEAGDRFTAGGPAVYILTADMEVQYFAHGEQNETWFGGSFADVVDIPGSCLDNYDQASPAGVSYLPGSVLVKRVESGTVYALLPGSVRAPLGSMEVAEALYGADWPTLVRDIHSFLWNDYTDGAEISEAVPHDGQLVTTADSDDVYHVMDGMYHMVDGDLGFLSAFVRTVSQEVFDTLEMADDTVTPASVTEDPTQGAMGSDDDGDEDEDEPAPAGGDLTFALAGSTPDTVTVPGGALGVPYLTFNVTAGDEDAELNSVTVQLGGVGSSDDFDKVYLYHNGARLDNGRSLNSDDQATFNVNMMIDAGDTETFMVKADQTTNDSGDLTSGDENFFEISTEDDVDSTGDVGGSFPIVGNTMVMGSQDIGSVEVSAEGTDSEEEIGEDEVLVGQFGLEEGGDDDVWFSSIRLQNKGDADSAALSNLELRRGGSVVATGEYAGDDYYDFELDDLYEIESGDSESFKVYADIGIADVDDTFQLVLDEVSDLVIFSDSFPDFQAGVSHATGDELDTDNAMEITLAGGAINVDWEGTDEDVAVDQNNVVFGVFEMVATAEDLDIDEMVFTLTKDDASDECLEDLRFRDANGNGSYALDEVEVCDAINTTSTFRVENLDIQQGVQYEFELVGDISNDADEDDAYTWSWDVDDVDGEGVDSDSTLTDEEFSSGSLTGPTMTVAESSLTVRSKSLSDKTVVPGSEDILVFRGTLEAGDVSDVEVTAMNIDAGASDSGDWDDLVAEFALYIGDDINIETDTPVDTDSSISGQSASFSSFSYDVLAGSSERVDFEIYAKFEDGSSTGTVEVRVEDVDATDGDDDVDPQDSDEVTIEDGAELSGTRTVTVAGTGELAIDMDNDFTGLRNNTYVLAGTAPYMIGRLELQAQNENIYLEDLGLHVDALFGDTDDVENSFDSIMLYTSSDMSEDSEIGSEDVTDDDITFDDLDYLVMEDATQYLYIGVTVNSIGKSGDDGTAVASTTIEVRAEDDNTTARGESSTGSLDAGDVNVTETLSNETTVLGVQITFGSDFASGNLQGGDQTLGSFTITADANGNNTTNTGKVLSAHIQEMAIFLSTDVGTGSAENVSDLELCRVDTTDCVDLEVHADDLEFSDVTTTARLVTSGDTAVDFTDLSTGGNTIDSGETVEFTVKGNMSNTEDNFAQVSIRDLDDGGVVWSYDLNEDGTMDFTHEDLLADEPRDSDYPDFVINSLD